MTKLYIKSYKNYVCICLYTYKIYINTKITKKEILNIKDSFGYPH
uniref:Uncharacterized protein n=1 Tax=viral metagenome TaxID=1070528 RepID=A0A6C0KTG7_9ZZZZ